MLENYICNEVPKIEKTISASKYYDRLRFQSAYYSASENFTHRPLIDTERVVEHLKRRMKVLDLYIGNRDMVHILRYNPKETNKRYLYAIAQTDVYDSLEFIMCDKPCCLREEKQDTIISTPLKVLSDLNIRVTWDNN